MANSLKKGAFFTDIHFGKKANSRTHNQDCLNFIEWFCQQVREDPDIDYVGFLGDWNENRSSINIDTLGYSYQGARALNQLGLPVFFVQASKTGAGSVSPADTAMRSEERSAPSSIAASMAR